ncbi:amino acid adenylation domain-containing protein [Streptomyces antimicrobicus]|uniref:Amino acid adenylation domain-containing protein n=1 Tax=Streptomyces antimicrobicus TaxID=2883108 RepID=A0ABS8B2K0_9ACTN|nr:amino acid adenylation domain-containing protein [Streptomyces antimicrobicus]MCB5178806.1 amino acid adenylation domain-containing protein [Streptomyces antimicrobicus]
MTAPTAAATASAPDRGAVAPGTGPGTRPDAGSAPGPDVLDLWDRSVRAHGDRPALVTPHRVLAYREADRLTDAWAAALAERGAGPGRLVGLAFGDPARTVLGMLAALKAGAGFTVLDDRLPPAARAALVRRTAAAVWLGDGGHAPAGAFVPPADPDGDPGGATAARPAPQARGCDVAYVLFTSGSTGQPKGTVVERDALGRFAVAVAERLELTADDRWLQVASLGFDVLIEEVFPAFAAGAAVVCRRDTLALDAEELHITLARTRTTVVELSTQYWLEYARWLAAADATTPAGLRTVVVGGERMDPRPYRQWQARQPAALAHVYGLTECTVSSTFYTGLLPADAAEVPLGTPLRDVEISIRRDGRPVPDGETGEIHIGGPLLARGFLDDDAATARRFVPDPYAAGPGARVYVTGDLGRIDAEGRLVFLGRVDDQVKIRGHRLEPARVERALCETPGVGQAVVFPDPATGTALWAFTVPADPALAPLPGEAVRLTGGDRDALVAALAAQLPDWAVPRVLYRVAVLPKNPHGKIDKRLLAAWAAAPEGPGGDAPGAGRGTGPADGPGTGPAAAPGADPADAPGEPLATVLGLFREVLGAPGLGPDDNFFDHGGQSLLAMRLLARLRESRPAAAGLRASALFAAPTPRLLAEALADRGTTGP